MIATRQGQEKDIITVIIRICIMLHRAFAERKSPPE